MDDLITFLRARLEDDEQLARVCAGAPWVDDVPRTVHVDPEAIRDVKWKFGNLGYVAGADPGELGDAYRCHIARHDPARVLREVNAKRQMVARHPCDECGSGNDPCNTLRLLALPYADHPGYREEWKP